jgi:predicted RNA binding protein YcfA (HicA-like mRNA interferase family)
MEGFTKQVKKLLTKAGCYFLRHAKGDHDIWFSPVSGTQVTVDNKIMSRHTANETLKQAGLPKAF